MNSELDKIWQKPYKYGKTMTVGFEWDLSKDLANLRKHKVSFLESVETFLDPKGIQLVDQKHSGRGLHAEEIR